MNKVTSAILLILTIFAVTAQTKCEYNFAKAKYEGLCLRDCKQYTSFEAASIDCDQFTDCVGISFNSDANYYFLTGNGKYTFSGYNSFIKNCEPNSKKVTVDGFIQLIGQYIGECINGCQDYKTLKDAITVCKTLQSCGGVTLARKEHGGYNSKEIWGYQLRFTRDYYPSRYGESSWLK